MTPELEKKIEEAAKIYLVRKYEANFDDDSGIVSASFFTAISDDMVSFATTSTKVKDYWQKGMYTEEEVLSLLKRVGREITYPETYYEPLDIDENNDKYFNGEVEEWFKQNKKK